MSALIRIAFLITFVAALGGKVLAQSDFDGVFDVEDYEAVDDEQYWPPQMHPWKRAGFWSPHPSDYNPMRKPGSAGQAPRSSSKKADSPYHPVPRTVNQNQVNLRNSRSGPDELETMLEELRDREKRQSPGSFLLMKLGRISNAKTGPQTNRRVDRRKPL